jgi:diacylglycerol O-acyltransferase / wax synthase
VSQEHLDRLSAIDAGFLAQERDGSHMHIGAALVFEGPLPEYDELMEHVESRLHLVPRYRQKLATPRLELGRPLWIDDPKFNLGYHIRHTALPRPGSIEQLRLLTARIFSQRLDRSKPLWEMWLVEGLDEDRFAVIIKSHHCLVDGVSGVDITNVLFDLERDPAEPVERGAPWTPGPEPTDAVIAVRGIRDLVEAPIGLARRALGAMANPGPAITKVREAVEGVGQVAWTYVNSEPDTPMNVPIGPYRRVTWVRSDLDRLKAIKNGLGGTVNDVFLTVVTGALTRWLRARGVDTKGLELYGCVPVSVRAPGEEGALGNQITIMSCPLPVYADDPRDRLRIVREAMQGLKDSKRALGAETIAGLQDFTPPTIFAQASRLNFSSRMYNLLVTNVPGPQFPLYLLGRELEQLVPIPFLGPEKALAIAIMSYNGGVHVSLMGDYDALDDLDDLAVWISDEIAALAEVAGQAEAAASN